MRGGKGFGGGAEKGAGLGRRGRGSSQGVGGNCVCPSCGATVPHERGIPCTDVKCPECGSQMTRQR